MAGAAYFIIEGGDSDLLGASASTAGNLDDGSSGIAEFIIGTPGDDPVGALLYSGADSGVGDGILTDASNLTRITFSTGGSGDSAGFQVLGGFDFDGDGIGDAALLDAGNLYVIYGGASVLGSDLTAADLTGTTGLAVSIAGLTEGSTLGFADFDGDGKDEILVGLPGFGSGNLAGQGRVLAVGHSATGSETASVDGIAALDGLGGAVSGLSDINGDGLADIVIAAPGADDPGSGAGAAYVVFGTLGSDPLTGLDLSALDGSNGFRLTGIAAFDGAGVDVSDAGDLNGDGTADLLISAPNHDGAANNSGEVYVVYGKGAGGFGADIDLGALGSGGLTLTSNAAGARAGLVATGIGDVSGDGADDLLVLGTDPGSGTVTGYIVFGGALGTGTLNLDGLSAAQGYVLTGLDLGPLGDAPVGVSLGDVNNDGINDIGIAAPGAGAVDNGVLIGLLGGIENLKALDGDADGIIDLGDIADGTPPAISFVPTNTTVSYSGSFFGTIDLRADETEAEGLFSITDTNDPTARFDTAAGTTPEGTGSYGALVVTPAASSERWVYTVSGAALLDFLGDGETIQDVVLLTASNGSQRDVVIEFTGKDDAAEVTLTPALSIPLTEDFASYSGSFAIFDPDQNDDPDLAGATLQSANGRIEISADGTAFTYFLTTNLQALNGGQTVTETFSTVSKGVPVAFSLEIEGRDEDLAGITYVLTGNGATAFFGPGSVDVTGTDGNDRIDTGTGDDTVRGGGGNDLITDPAGDDVIEAGAGDDRVSVLSGTNTVTNGAAGADSNHFEGGIGQDDLTGGNGRDVLDGDAVSSILGGADRLTPGAGDDVARGGIGADTFVFAPSEGTNRIADFDGVTYSQANGYQAFGFDRDFEIGVDVIELAGFATLASAADARAAVSDIGGHATFVAEGTTIILHGIATADLTADSFILT